MIPHLDKLPKNRRYTLGEKLENRLLTILESLVTAAYAPNKRTFLFQANRDLEVCRQAGLVATPNAPAAFYKIYSVSASDASLS